VTRLTAEARRRSGTGLLSVGAGAVPSSVAQCDPREGRRHVQSSGDSPHHDGGSHVLALSVSVPTAGPWHAGQRLPAWQL